MVDYTQYDNAVREIAPQLQYAAEFVPLSKSRNANEKHPTLNWRVQFVTTGPGARFGQIVTDYQQGIAHLPGYVHKWNGGDTIADREYRTLCAERGRYSETGGGVPGPHKIPAPTISEVLSCLILDAEAIEYATFEDWADNVGYDSDSRKAEAIYRSCLETGLKLRNMLGDDKLTRLREALQDI